MQVHVQNKDDLPLNTSSLQIHKAWYTNFQHQTTYSINNGAVCAENFEHHLAIPSKKNFSSFSQPRSPHFPYNSSGRNYDNTLNILLILL